MNSKTNHLDGLTISLMVDDMLDADQYNKATAHLDACPHCQALYQDLQTTSFSMLKLETLSPPPEFAQSILEKLPPQDPVNPEHTISLQKANPKINPLAQIPWQQWGLLAACAALALTFLPSSNNQPSLQRDSDTNQTSPHGRYLDSDEQSNDLDAVLSIQDPQQEEEFLPAAMTPFTLEDDMPMITTAHQEETSLFASYFPQEGLQDKARILLEMDIEQMEQIVQDTTGKPIKIICNYNQTPADNTLPLPDPWIEIPSQEWISYKLWEYKPEETALLDALTQSYPTLTHQLPQCVEGDVFLFLIPSHIPLVEFAREN